MKEGWLGYFPEGTHYGPQSSESESSTLVLQFGGASGSGYIAAGEYEKAAAELARHGAFAKGVYTRLKPDGGKINKDAYEAVWEQVNGRPLVYPPERYLRPVFMDPEKFDWIPVARQPGVSRKLMGEFSERGTRIAFYRLDAGAALPLDDNSIYFVVKGSGAVEGRTFGRQATIHLDTGERATVTASEMTELLHLGLPHLS